MGVEHRYKVVGNMQQTTCCLLTCAWWNFLKKIFGPGADVITASFVLCLGATIAPQRLRACSLGRRLVGLSFQGFVVRREHLVVVEVVVVVGSGGSVI